MPTEPDIMLSVPDSLSSNNILESTILKLYNEVINLYKMVHKSEEEINILKYEVKNLKIFVRSTIDFMTDETHFDCFVNEHLSRFIDILEKNGLYVKVEEKIKNGERNDITIRLDKIRK